RRGAAQDPARPRRARSLPARRRVCAAVRGRRLRARRAREHDPLLRRAGTDPRARRLRRLRLLGWQRDADLRRLRASPRRARAARPGSLLCGGTAIGIGADAAAACDTSYWTVGCRYYSPQTGDTRTQLGLSAFNTTHAIFSPYDTTRHIWTSAGGMWLGANTV